MAIAYRVLEQAQQGDLEELVGKTYGKVEGKRQDRRRIERFDEGIEQKWCWCWC